VLQKKNISGGASVAICPDFLAGPRENRPINYFYLIHIKTATTNLICIFHQDNNYHLKQPVKRFCFPKGRADNL